MILQEKYSEAVIDKDDHDDDLTIEIAEDINTMEDLVRFPPPMVFCLRLEQ